MSVLGPAPDVTVFGSGQYVSGLDSGHSGSSPGERTGVIALALADLKRRGLVGDVRIICTSQERCDAVREHLRLTIDQRYHGLSGNFKLVVMPRTIQTFARSSENEIAIIVTPDDTHFPIAERCLDAGVHTLVMKPLVKDLSQHLSLLQLAQERGRWLAIDYHKRFDPIYMDARARARELGDFSFMASFMSQPASQLQSFAKWAGKHSDVSYYLNSHHVDYLTWLLEGQARPVRVNAGASWQASEAGAPPREDQISLTVAWELALGRGMALSVHSASWIAAKSDAHSQQRFHYMGTAGEITIDQARRGYLLATDKDGLVSVNPLFMRFTSLEGKFVGQDGYGYRSIEAFVQAASGATPAPQLATASNTIQTTAILHAGRLSLDRQGNAASIGYGNADWFVPIRVSSVANMP